MLMKEFDLLHPLITMVRVNNILSSQVRKGVQLSFCAQKILLSKIWAFNCIQFQLVNQKLHPKRWNRHPHDYKHVHNITIPRKTKQDHNRKWIWHSIAFMHFNWKTLNFATIFRKLFKFPLWNNIKFIKLPV